MGIKLKDIAIIAYREMEAEAAREAEARQETLDRTAAHKFSDYFGMPPDRVENGKLYKDDLTIRYNHAAKCFELAVLCPDCLKSAWSDGFFDLIGLGREILTQTPNYTHVCPGLYPAPGNSWQDRLVAAVTDAVQEALGNVHISHNSNDGNPDLGIW